MLIICISNKYGNRICMISVPAFWVIVVYANEDPGIFLDIVSTNENIMQPVAVLGGPGGHGPRPRAFGNPEWAPRLRKN